MASYQDKKTKRWRFRFRYKNVRYSGSAPRGHNTKRVADQLEKDLLEKLQKRAYTGVMPTVKEFVTKFLEHQQTHTKALTYRGQKAHLEIHVLPHIGGLRMDAVGQRELDELKTTWRATAAPRTVNTRMGTVLRVFALAVEWRIIDHVPKVAALKIAKDTPRFLSQDEAQRLLTAAADPVRGRARWYAMVLVGLRTGLRIGELRGLQWQDINFTSGALAVRRTAPGVAGVLPNAPKGGRSRVVPLTTETIAALRAWQELMRAQVLELEGRKLLATDWVWPAIDRGREGDGGGTRSEGGCSTAIAMIAERAGVPDCSWHTLRHTYASWLAVRGVSLRIIQELLGHSSIRQTELYANLVPNQVHHAAVASLDLALLEVGAELGPEPDAPRDQPVAKALPEPPGSRSGGA